MLIMKETPPSGHERPDLPLRTAADPSPGQTVTLYEALASGGMAVGTIVQSMAGHDFGRLAVIIAIRPPFASIVDGKHRPVGKPKRKRLKHLRPVATVNPDDLSQAIGLPEEGQRDSAIRKLIAKSLPESSPARKTLPEEAAGTHP